jgi:hypothetical protein
MKIELAFETILDDLEGAIAEIHVEDQSEADAPSLRLDSKRFGPFDLPRLQPTVNLDVDLPVANPNQELSLIVRVKAHTQNHQPVEFLNTTTTPLIQDANGTVQVALSRIV